MTPRILVAGLGNVLMSDDGIGPYCAQYLIARYEFGDEIEVADLGTPGLDLTLHLASADIVIAIDALRGVEAGTLHVFNREALLDGRSPTRLDTHAPALEESILIARLAGDRPSDVTLVGVGGVSFDHGTSLSPLVSERVEALAELVLSELTRAGGTWRRRAIPQPVDAWWQQPATATA